MKWSAFKQEVEDLLGYEGDREAHTAFIEKAKRLAAIDLQRAVGAYRVGHTTVFDAGSITLNGSAATMAMPEGASPTTIWYDNVDDPAETPCQDWYSRKKLEWHPWGRRGELVCNDARLPEPGAFTYSRSELYAAPVTQEELDSGSSVIMEWKGKKLDFQDGDDTPFDESAVNAAHLYVTYKFLKHIDRVNDGWKVQQDYERERAMIIADKNSE